MKLVIKEKNKVRINRLFDWLLHMIGYTIVFIGVTSLFKSIYIDSDHLILWSAIIVLIIYILNKTIKPIIVRLTIPITALTLGIFYPFINVIILKMVDLLLGRHFPINGIFIACIAALLISAMNMLMDKLIIKPVIGKEN